MALIRAMISGRPQAAQLGPQWEQSQVEDMLDGGMGSIRFVGQQSHERRLDTVMREANYVDADGVKVIIGINLDQNGALFEVDFWKVDFSPLCRYPSVNDLEFEQ
jgi:hypothetical protein